MPKSVAIGFLCLLSSVARAGVITSALVDITGETWSYTLSNNEPAGSNNWLTSFNLYINTLVTVTGAPFGWDYFTDGASFVSWFNTDLDPPFPDDVAP